MSAKQRADRGRRSYEARRREASDLARKVKQWTKKAAAAKSERGADVAHGWADVYKQRLQAARAARNAARRRQVRAERATGQRPPATPRPLARKWKQRPDVRKYAKHIKASVKAGKLTKDTARRAVLAYAKRAPSPKSQQRQRPTRAPLRAAPKKKGSPTKKKRTYISPQARMGPVLSRPLVAANAAADWWQAQPDKKAGRWLLVRVERADGTWSDLYPHNDTDELARAILTAAKGQQVAVKVVSTVAEKPRYSEGQDVGFTGDRP